MNLRVLVVVVALASLQGCLAVLIPGSVVGSVSDAITGAEGTNCVGPVAKVGDRIHLQDGSVGVIRSLSGTSSRCTQPNFPIRAQLGPLESDGRTNPTVPAAQASSSSPKSQSKLGLSLPAGWVTKPLPDSVKSNNESALYATNLTLDAGLMWSTVPRDSISDFRTFAATRRAVQISSIAETVPSDISSLEINGKKALRFTVTGKVKTGQMMTYLMTLVQGDKEIAIINTWTLAANFEQHRATLEGMPQYVAGL